MERVFRSSGVTVWAKRVLTPPKHERLYFWQRTKRSRWLFFRFFSFGHAKEKKVNCIRDNNPNNQINSTFRNCDKTISTNHSKHRLSICDLGTVARQNRRFNWSFNKKSIPLHCVPAYGYNICCYEVNQYRIYRYEQSHKKNCFWCYLCGCHPCCVLVL